jgi:hypothetical protein
MVAEYGDPRRAEFNYSSNVKGRIESKIFTDFGVKQSGMWRIDAGGVGRWPIGGWSREYLSLAILRAAAYTPPIRINRSALLIAPNRLYSPRHR